MYAILNVDGSLAEIRMGAIDDSVNTKNREKRYAVPFDEQRPALKPGEQYVFVRRDITADSVTDIYGTEPIPPVVTPRDLAAELDAIKADVARTKAAEAVLIEKGTVTAAEIDAKVPAREVGAIEAAKP